VADDLSLAVQPLRPDRARVGDERLHGPGHGVVALGEDALALHPLHVGGARERAGLRRRGQHHGAAPTGHVVLLEHGRAGGQHLRAQHLGRNPGEGEHHDALRRGLPGEFRIEPVGRVQERRPDREAGVAGRRHLGRRAAHDHRMIGHIIEDLQPQPRERGLGRIGDQAIELHDEVAALARQQRFAEQVTRQLGRRPAGVELRKAQRQPAR
jgi:hypothetical protein